MYDGSTELLSVVLEETGGLGVDIVIDSGGKKYFSASSSVSQFVLIVNAREHVRL